MKVSLVNPKNQRGKMIKMGVSWFFLGFVILCLLPGFILTFKGAGLLVGAVFIWLAVKGNRMQVRQLVKKGWIPTTEEDRMILMREGYLRG